MPIHAFDGELDSAVPVAATRDTIAALEKAGGKPKVTIYPGVDHICWTRTCDDPELELRPSEVITRSLVRQKRAPLLAESSNRE